MILKAIRPTDVEVELITLRDELLDAQNRLKTANATDKPFVKRQIRQIERDIQRYSKHA